MHEQVRLSRAQAEEMIEHCLAGRPNEACGLLAAKDGSVTKVFRMSNASASPVRYSLDPKEQFAAYQALEKKGWELGGVFHSPTRPLRFHRLPTFAWPAKTFHT